MKSTSNAKGFLAILTLLQLLVYLLVLLDIPVARQLIVFGYFIFVPGFIIMKLAGLHEFGKIETFFEEYFRKYADFSIVVTF